MAAINGYIDRRSEEKKTSGKVWEEAGGLYTGENGVLLLTVQIYTLHMHNVQYILRGNCGRGREKGCTEERGVGEAEERERVERGRRGREEREEREGGEGGREGGEGGRRGRRGREEREGGERRGRRSGREEREEWEGGDGGRSRKERKGGEGGRRDRG